MKHSEKKTKRTAQTQIDELNGQRTAEDEQFYWSEESESFTTASKDDYKYPKKPSVFLRDCKYNMNVTICYSSIMCEFQWETDIYLDLDYYGYPKIDYDLA